MFACQNQPVCQVWRFVYLEFVCLYAKKFNEEGLIDTIKKIREFFNIFYRIFFFYIVYELRSWLFDFFMQIELGKSYVGKCLKLQV